LNNIELPGKALHIALISPQFPPSIGGGGISTSTFHQAIGLTRLGHKVDIYTWLDSPVSQDINFPRLTVKRLNNPKWLNWLENNMNRILRFFARIGHFGKRVSFVGALRDLRGMMTFLNLVRIGRFQKYDIIEIPEWGGACAAFKKKFIQGTLIVKLHGSLYSHYYNYRQFSTLSRLDKIIASWVEMKGVVNGDIIICPSCTMANEAYQWLGVTKDIKILPNTIDFPWFDENLKKSRKIESLEEPIRVLFSGRIDPMKGAHIINDLVGRLRSNLGDKNWDFILAGDASGINRFSELCIPYQSKVSIQLPGYLSMEDLICELGLADIFLFPSQSENFPMSILEAMAAGLPIIASEVGGIPDMVRRNVDGILCPKDDEIAFYDALMKLRNPELRKIFGDNARLRVKSYYSTDIILPKWLKLFSDFLIDPS